MAEFTHLHLHTQYSLLDGAIRVDQLFPEGARARHGHRRRHRPRQPVRRDRPLQRAKAHGVKPIFGCETYVAPDRHDKTERNSPPDPARQERRRLQEPLVPQLDGVPRGFYYNPRIDKKLLREHTEGLIGLSACLGGEIAQTIMRRGPEAAEDVAARVRGHLRQGQLLPRGAAERRSTSRRRSTATCRSSSKKTGIPLVATNDCHYLNHTDARAHDVLMCVQTEEDDQGREAAAPPQRGVLREDAGRDGRLLQARPRGDGERRAHRRAVQRQVQARRDVPAEVQGARGHDGRELPAGRRRGGPRRSASRRRTAAASASTRTSTARASSSSSASSRRWASRATSSSSGTSSARRRTTASPSGRAAARAPARSSRTRCASPTSIRSSTSSCSSASSTPSACRCRTSTSTSA